MKIMILGASYGSLLSTKLLMAGHSVTLVCLPEEAALINTSGTEVRLKLRDEPEHRSILSADLPGTLDAVVPDSAKPENYDLIGLAMQEPQYAAAEVAELLHRIADSGKPCMSIMNMPPLKYLQRIPALANADLSACYTDASVWEKFSLDNITLCSPDPQAFRPPEEKLNVLHVGLPTNFKAAQFGNPAHNEILQTLVSDIEGLSIDGKNVPVKLKMSDSVFVPLAKWSMLLTGNYRCVQADGIQAIKDAVHGNLEQSEEIYTYVSSLVEKMGGDASDGVPFGKYADAARSLQKPSSAARAIDAGAPRIERVDKVVQTIGKLLGMSHPEIDNTVRIVDARLAKNLEKANQASKSKPKEPA